MPRLGWWEVPGLGWQMDGRFGRREPLSAALQLRSSTHSHDSRTKSDLMTSSTVAQLTRARGHPWENLGWSEQPER